MKELFFKTGLLLILILILASCAPKKPVRKAPRPPVKPTGPAEVIHPKPPPAGATTPKRAASNGLVEDGRTALSAGELERAETFFQEAIGLDGTNGIAYYYLAKAKYEAQEFQEALGILDKAESLLRGSKEWMETVDALREMIEEVISDR